MKIVKLISAALLLQACSEQSTDVRVADSGPSHPTYTAEDFYKTVSIGGSSINHDGTAVLVSSDATGIYNAYRQPLDGSEPTQLTNSTLESTYAISWFPGDDRILYFADQGGNENDHIYVREMDGSSSDLTPGDAVKASFMRWHEDDQSFFVMTNERDARYYDVYEYEVADYSRAMVFENNTGYSPQRVSPNGAYLSLRLEHNNTNSDVFLANMSGGEPTLVTAHEGDVDHSTYAFTADSSKLIYATNEYGEYNQAWSYDIESGERALHYKNDNWDVSSLYFSDDGKYQVASVNDDASTKVTISDTKSGGEILMPNLPAGELRGVNFSDDSRNMVFYINSDTSPSNLYVHEIGTGSATRLTNSGNPDIDESALVPSEVVRFKSFDGLEIPGLLYKPKQASATNKVPAIVYVHGGPGGQSRKGYNPTVQHLVNNGYAVMRINNRGSSGYGKTFYHMDDKKHGDVDLQDVVYNKKYFQSLDWVDADKIGVMGGSYGGYMVMAAMAFTDEFDVGVNIFGVTNWVRTLKSIPAHWEATRKGLYDELGDPELEEERLHNISPVFFGHQVKSPVLVVQGSNDPRVLQVESDDMVAAIREGGTYVDYLIFDDEGHGFTKRDNRIEASNKYLEFLDGYLKGND